MFWNQLTKKEITYFHLFETKMNCEDLEP